ncbi:DUF2933 domain-containing protein [Candidatus Saccharibacteria bacterium]|nr:DUF2933 domain-containing protein [Candidatus Saccharibacteria bacterium]
MRIKTLYKQPKVAVPFVILSIIAAYYLITEHNAHVRSALPVVLLLAFLLLHMGMHGGHGKGLEDSSSASRNNPSAKPPHQGHEGGK